MPGQPQHTCPAPLFFGVDLVNLATASPIVDATQAFNVDLTFVASGPLATFLTGPGNGVAFTVTYYFESFGGGPEGQLGQFNGNTDDGGFIASSECVDPNAWDYTASISVSANTLQSGETYKLTAVLTSAFPMRAFVEGPVISTR